MAVPEYFARLPVSGADTVGSFWCIEAKHFNFNSIFIFWFLLHTIFNGSTTVLMMSKLIKTLLIMTIFLSVNKKNILIMTTFISLNKKTLQIMTIF